MARFFGICGVSNRWPFSLGVPSTTPITNYSTSRRFIRLLLNSFHMIICIILMLKSTHGLVLLVSFFQLVHWIIFHFIINKVNAACCFSYVIGESMKLLDLFKSFFTIPWLKWMNPILFYINRTTLLLYIIFHCIITKIIHPLIWLLKSIQLLDPYAYIKF